MSLLLVKLCPNLVKLIMDERWLLLEVIQINFD